jgi:hypothetical protein
MSKKLTFDEAAQILDKTITDILDQVEPQHVVPLANYLISDIKYALSLRKKKPINHKLEQFRPIMVKK